MCAGVGLIGLILPRNRSAPATPAAPIDAVLLNVQEMNQRPPAEAIRPAAPQSPAEAAPPPPELPDVAAPSPVVAFAIPTNAPVHVTAVPPVVAPRPAANLTPSPSPNPETRPSVIQLTFGEGEGAQPAPEYPPEAVIGGEEGTVTVRMTVAEDGRVTDVAVVTPCTWPLLNNAAARTVRTQWRFSKGAARSYQVSIQFQINRHE